MALITEDGTGLANAESLCSVADADTYFSNRGNTTWTALSTVVKEQCLRRATDFMAQAYRNAWRGWRRTYVQALDWPRQNVLLEDYPLSAYVLLNIVPQEIKYACAELAYRASQFDLAPDLDRLKSKVTVGPVVVEYNPASPAFKTYRAVNMWLKPFLMTGGNSAMMRLERC